MRFKIIFLGSYNGESSSIAHTFYAVNWSIANRMFKDWISQQHKDSKMYELEEF